MKNSFCLPGISLFSLLLFVNVSCNNVSSVKVDNAGKVDSVADKKDKSEAIEALYQAKFDTTVYNKKLAALANGDTTGKWPANRELRTRNGSPLLTSANGFRARLQRLLARGHFARRHIAK